MSVKCFLIVSTGMARVRLRRFVFSCEGEKCAGEDGYHNAFSEEVARVPTGSPVCVDGSLQDYPFSDARWPTQCRCGYQFTDNDERQAFSDEIYTHEGKDYFLRDNIPGMMWDATWLHEYPQWCGPDGKSLHVICPGGAAWCIDSRCSNCTLPKDNTHKCWIRHGEPPMLTVDKRGVTCSAGAGSIQTYNWHGFLRNGELVS